MGFCLQANSEVNLQKITSSQDSGHSVDVLKEITQSTLSQNYNLALSGGNENGKFRASFLGSSAPGFLKKTSFG